MFTKSARFYDAIYSFKDYADEAARVDAVIREHNPEARTLLDVACGTGLHLERLRSRYDAEGLDLDPELLAVARERNPGIPLHEGDMRSFDLGHTFDAVTCLFSSIGYVETTEGLDTAIARMASHLEPGGVLVVEPWFTPDGFEEGHLGAVFVDEPDLKIARLDRTEVEARTSIIDFHYLVATPDGVSYFTEDHRLEMFTHEEYLTSFAAAGLNVTHDPEGLMGRGLYVGVSLTG